MNKHLKVNYAYLFDQQYEVGITVRENQNNFGEHTHDYIEIVFQLEGDIEHIVNKEKYFVKKNQMIIIGIDDVHQNIQANAKSLIILISEKYLNNIVIESAFDPSILSLKHFLLTGTPTVIDITSEMTSLIRSIYTNYIDKSSAYYIRQRMLITQFILELESEAILNSPQQPNNSDLISYILENLQTASLHEYAEIIHYSPVTTTSKIKEKYGMTFSQIVKQIRLKKAADLLADSMDSVELIMEQIGYTNKTYFYKNFKEVYNLSPASYRGLYRK